jgi:rubrerythrin
MDLSNANTSKNLEAAFGGESMANRKYLFFAEVTRQLGLSTYAKLITYSVPKLSRTFLR